MKKKRVIIIEIKKIYFGIIIPLLIKKLIPMKIFLIKKLLISIYQ
jgi:hypothetical protein